MRDYEFYDGQGNPVLVAQMSDTDLQDVLDHGFEMINDAVTRQAIEERLRLEQFIRQLGLGVLR